MSPYATVAVNPSLPPTDVFKGNMTIVVTFPYHVGVLITGAHQYGAIDSPPRCTY